ncbi:MAG: phage major capsid protein [Candidatus Thioglobus sp. TMED218]|nr:MAG: phage major capsid protein [Candidatus Thioglobus sp. TMED218]|tara:strand:- start:9068 stop:11500 length:2433 start_codon:yes stop_codon:yes gene_type:complete
MVSPLATNFPAKGDDKKVSLRNSNFERFDIGFAKNIKEFNPEIWELGGNIRGNEAFEYYAKYKDGSRTDGVMGWVREREAWSARHFQDGKQFVGGELTPSKSNIAGVVAQMKWGSVGVLGEQSMKDMMLELIKKLEGEERKLSGPIETDLFPSGDKLQSVNEEDSIMDELRHIEGITEDDDSITIRFLKSEKEIESEEEIEYPEEIEEDRDEEREVEAEVEAEVRDVSSIQIVRRSDAMEAEEIEDRRVRMSVSSETPVDREFGREIVVHDRKSLNIDFGKSGNMPLLLNHDPEDQIGVIDSMTLDEGSRKVRAVARFSKSDRASEILEDIRDGIRGNVSIGYIVNKMVRDDDDEETYRVVDAEIKEVSIVSLPADSSVGVGRSLKNKVITVEDNTPMTEETKTTDQAVEKKCDVKEIMALGKRHNLVDLAVDAVSNQMPTDQFRGQLLEKIADKPLEVDHSVGLNQRETREYSLMNGIRSLMSGEGSFEKEVSQELQQRYGQDPRGMYVPSEFFSRDITTASPAHGSRLIETEHLAGDFVDALRANLVTASLGARMMTGLQGDVQIPALHAATAAAFVAENGAPTEGAPTFRQITMAPKELRAYVDISRRLAFQSSPSVEDVIRQDLIQGFARKVDEVAIEGGGTNEPTGILATSGIGSVAMGTNGGAITYAKLVDLEEEVGIDNALTDNAAYLTNPKVVSAMRQTSRQSSGVEGNFILNDENTLLGYRVARSTLAPSDLTKGSSSGVCSAVLFGNFNDLMIGMFGGLDVVVDPNADLTTGAVRVAAFQMIDVAVRHAQSFAAIQDVTT